ncbi:DUF1513 domain-containing protein [Rhodoferax sp.]|uniref:DUF1513 domain-containing protein n=1 Tax=Rhodoferax sp. TaxID=50421 RepID=UPI00374D49AD
MSTFSMPSPLLPPLSRREWLALLSASMALPAFPAFAATAPAHAAGLLTAWVSGSDNQAWAGVWHIGSAPRGLALPNRVHEVQMLHNALGQPTQALAVARRPGEFLLRFDIHSARAVQWHDIEDDRVLCGHAAFAHDGSVLYTTETSTETGAGFIAVRDPVSLEKLREFSSGGLDPHAVMVEPDGSLLVANGGLLNLPETGRVKLNRAQMDSSLARLDPTTGEQRQAWRVNDPFLSLRHLARAADDTIAVAMQAEHADAAARRTAPLLALLDKSGLRTVALPDALALGGYAGDVAYVPGRNAQTADRFVISATRAGQLAWWSAQGDTPQQLALPEAGALAVHGADWLASGAQGCVRGEMEDHALEQQLRNVRWDNHGKWLA